MRIYLDANVLFSAAKSDGAVRDLLSALTRKGHELCADGYVVEEARRNLLLKAPAEAIAALEKMLEKIVLKAMVSASPPRMRASLPEKDRPILEAAIRHRCDVLVTGDKTHFGSFYGMKLEGVEILSPAQLARKLITSGPPS